MSLLLLVVSALHILILVLLFVATLDKSWWTLPDKESLNLWYDCTWNTTTQTWACSNVSENGEHMAEGRGRPARARVGSLD